MSRKHQHLGPRKIKGHGDEAWWYEEPEGVSVVCEFRNKDGEHQQTKVMLLSWRLLRNALERKDCHD